MLADGEAAEAIELYQSVCNLDSTALIAAASHSTANAWLKAGVSVEVACASEEYGGIWCAQIALPFASRRLSNPIPQNLHSGGLN